MKYYINYLFSSLLCRLYPLWHYYLNYIFVILLSQLWLSHSIICIIFSLHIISIITIMAMKIIDIIRIIDIIAVQFICLPPAHSSGIWLQILGLTAGMHSYTSEAAIEAKILRNPGGWCTSVLAGTRMKQAFSTVFDPRSYTSGTLQSIIFGRMFILLMHRRENKLESSEHRQSRR